MNKILSFIFTAVFIVILYIIIILALRVMYKDVKAGGRKKVLKSSWGLEVVSSGDNSTLKTGSIVPIKGVLTLGRREDNVIVLDDHYVSGHHAKIYTKNNQYILEDLNSTNGTVVNGENINGRLYIQLGDEIKIGSLIFKVIG